MKYKRTGSRPEDVSPDVGFKRQAPMAEGMPRVVQPGSMDWNELGMERRLRSVPYVGRLISGNRARLMYSELATTTCREKSRAGGIEMERVLKTLHIRSVFSEERYLISVGGKGNVRLTSAFSAFPETEGISFSLADEPPPGMKRGTCTPLVSHETMAGIEFMVLESPSTPIGRRKGVFLGECEVDVSIGGTDEIANRLSLRVGYSDLVEALGDAYPGRIRIAERIERC